MGVNKIACYCKNCNKEIEEHVTVCPFCKSDLNKIGSKLYTISVSDKLNLSDSQKMKVKNQAGKIYLKHRVDKNGTQHRIRVDRTKNPPDVYHSVWKDGKKIHHHKKN